MMKLKELTCQPKRTDDMALKRLENTFDSTELKPLPSQWKTTLTVTKKMQGLKALLI